MRDYKKYLPYKLFGKKTKDLTPEEYRTYMQTKGNEYYARTHKKYAFEKSFLRKMYGQNKKFKTLSPEERKEYNRLKQRECRAKKKIENNLKIVLK